MLIYKKLISKIKVVSLFALGNIINIFTQLILSIFIINKKTIEFWGEYSEYYIWVNFFLLFIAFGNKDYLLKTFSVNPSTIYSKWSINLVSRSIFLIPFISILFLCPTFDKLGLLLSLWLIILFINQSFNVLIIYFKDFKFSLITELIAFFILLISVSINLEYLTFELLISLLIIAEFTKAISYIFHYSKHLKKGSFYISSIELKKTVPFFIPVALGTIVYKMDLYYASLVFNDTELGKYQLLTSFLNIGFLIATFFITPYLKTFYRLNSKTMKKIKTQVLVFGSLYSFMFIIFTKIAFKQLYSLNFSFFIYCLALISIVFIIYQTILLSQLYRFEKQNSVSYITLSIGIIQLALGYLLTKSFGIEGALLLKTTSITIITIIFWLILIPISKSSR